MNAVFVKVANMSVSAAWLILAVIVLRLVLRRAPRWITCLLWAFVAIRLVCPFSLHSPVSAYQVAAPEAVQESGQVEYFQYVHASGDKPSIMLDIGADEAVPDGGGQAASTHGNPTRYLPPYVTLWLVVGAALLLYGIFSTVRLRYRMREAVCLRENIWVCDAVTSPFLLGVLRPRIYLPSGMDEGELRYVLAHEQAHLRRGDHIWKPLGYLLLALHWFNPLVWLAYCLFCRDIETACDERVVRTLDAAEKKAYSTALLSCSQGRRMVLACPVAFGEVGVKSRIRSVLHYKKPALWVIVAAVAVCIAVAVCFLTDPLATAGEDDTDQPMSAFFGHYEQDGSDSSGQELIQWRVLDRRDDELLLISQYALDLQSYTPLYEPTDPVGWQDSSLRQWLNSEFLNAAFTAEEQQKIVDTEITLSDTETVRDKVFLLTPEQVAAYMPTAEDAMASPTHYAQTRLPDYNTEPDTATCTWWLLSGNNGHAGVVLQNGSVNTLRSYEPAYVRPAIWVQADAVESSLTLLETVLGTDSDSARNVLLPAFRDPLDVTLTGVAEGSGGADLDSLIDGHQWTMHPTDAQPTGAEKRIVLQSSDGTELYIESGVDGLLRIGANGVAFYTCGMTGDEIIDALAGWAWDMKRGIVRSQEAIPDAETFFLRFPEGGFRWDIYESSGNAPMALFDLLYSSIEADGVTEAQCRALLLSVAGLDGAYSEGYASLLAAACEKDGDAYRAAWRGLTYRQQCAVPCDAEGVLPQPEAIRWSYDSGVIEAPYMTVNGGGTVFYMEVPDELAQRIRQRVAESMTLSGFTAPQLTNGWGRDLISWSAERAEVHLVLAGDYSEFYTLCRGEMRLWGLDTGDGVIEADGEVRELLAMIAALTGWEAENGREAFSGLTMAELIYNGRTLHTVTDAARLGSLQGLLQNGTQASFASKTPMERVELRMTRSDGTTVSVLLDTDSPRIFLPPFYYYEYNDYESTGTQPLLEALGLTAWPKETEDMDCSPWLNGRIEAMAPLPAVADGASRLTEGQQAQAVMPEE